MKNLYMGVDPGQSGAVAVVDEDGGYAGSVRLSLTPRDIADCVELWARLGEVKLCMLEQVHAMPRQGVVSTFKFGTSFGFCMGFLTCSRIPYEMVTPHKWQSRMRCKTKGDKNITKAAAQRLFPDVKITHALADALLLAEYARRYSLGIE